jgi:hypothetical protein
LVPKRSDMSIWVVFLSSYLFRAIVYHSILQNIADSHATALRADMRFPLSAAVFLACLVSTNADFRQRRIKESGRVSSGYRDGVELFDMRLCLAPSLVTNCLVRGLFRASYARNVHRAAVSESRADSKRDLPAPGVLRCLLWMRR